MNRRSVGLSALYAGALFVGAIAGGAASVPSAHAKPAPPSAVADSASQSPSQAPAQGAAKKAPPVHCKTTKECPQDHLCTKVSDHKECTPSAIRPPTAPMVT